MSNELAQEMRARARAMQETVDKLLEAAESLEKSNGEKLTDPITKTSATATQAIQEVLSETEKCLNKKEIDKRLQLRGIKCSLNHISAVLSRGKHFHNPEWGKWTLKKT